MHVLASVLLSFALSSAPVFAQEKYSILQGTTSETVSHFTVVAKASDDLRFEAAAKYGNEILRPEVTKVVHPGSEWAVYRLKFQGLKPSEKYSLRTIDSAANAITDQRIFKTLVTQTGAGRIALLSCMLRQLHNPFMWNNLEKPENRPDLMLFLGDSVYLDRTALFFAKLPKSTLEVWEDFVSSRNRLNVYKWKNLVPIVSIWDDHDSGGNNVSAKSFELMAKILPVYETFFANDEIPGTVNKAPSGLGKQFEAFGKNFIMMDGRYARELDDASPLFGEEQMQWAIDRIKPGGNFIISGTQFFGKALHKDSLESNWPEYAKQFVKRFKRAGEEKLASFAFGSGDIHFSEIQHLDESELFGYNTVETTSSSVHSTILPVPPYHWFKPNVRRSNAVSTHNVLLIELDSAITKFEFRVRALTWRGKMPFAEDIAVKGPCELYLENKKVP